MELQREPESDGSCQEILVACFIFWLVRCLEATQESRAGTKAAQARLQVSSVDVCIKSFAPEVLRSSSPGPFHCRGLQSPGATFHLALTCSSYAREEEEREEESRLTAMCTRSLTHLNPGFDTAGCVSVCDPLPSASQTVLHACLRLSETCFGREIRSRCARVTPCTLVERIVGREPTGVTPSDLAALQAGRARNWLQL
ncbi:Uncharacterized protein DAT39_015928 [Clarias magur]|uniref:Uncharacterized protein n=1 Tax=Clarias magur TaxID=1594786 RepID=A0A8J4TCN5_CLAMG|nr:Uncharacterized protein DAT39_015928 [Clarias magur]